MNREEKIRELELKELQILRKIAEHEENNKLEYFNTPKLPANPLQAELIEAWQDPSYKVFTYTGANRIGKTTIGAIVTFSTMIGKWLWSNQRLPFSHHNPRKVRIVGQDWEKHIQTVVIPALRKWWPKSRKLVTKKNNFGIEALWTDVATGSTLEIMSNNQDSDVFEGWDGDLIYWDEPPKRDIRVACARGLIDREGRELYCMTLLKEAWISTEVIKATEKDGTPDKTVYNVYGDIYSNVGFGISEKGVEQFAKSLTDAERKARLLGIPSYMEGLVCPLFSRKRHIVDRFDIPLDWVIDIHIDVHPRERQAIVFIATSPKNERYVCFEIFKHGSGKEIGEWIIRTIDSQGYKRIGKILVDPLAKGDKNVGETTFDKIDQVLARYGYFLRTASKDKESGIIEINNHLMGPNNQPSIFFFRDCKRMIMEIEGWMYDEDTQKPQKKDDHMCEGLYRILLENTIWYPQDEDEWEDDEGVNTYSNVTGY